MRAVALVVAVAALGVGLWRRPHVAVARAATPPVVADAARFRGAYLPGAALRTARTTTGALVAVADRAAGVDRSWGSSLLVARGARDVDEVCDRVFYASRPLPLPDGSVAVERGRAGAAVPGRMRVDALTVDVVDPTSGAARTVFRADGFEAHLAAVAGDEILVYLVQPDVASLVAVDWKRGTSRVIAPSLAGWAHDFAVVDGALRFHDRDAARPELQTTERIDLATGARTRLETFR